jgi:hypothetical protein
MSRTLRFAFFGGSHYYPRETADDALCNGNRISEFTTEQIRWFIRYNVHRQCDSSKICGVNNCIICSGWVPDELTAHKYDMSRGKFDWICILELNSMMFEYCKTEDCFEQFLTNINKPETLDV